MPASSKSTEQTPATLTNDDETGFDRVSTWFQQPLVGRQGAFSQRLSYLGSWKQETPSVTPSLSVFTP